ncbi:MAG TPA: hypothetical protein VHE35_21045 [Kofleriaceae bacterium]|nr:hypothetical protein [Kofleriaceae bacterium]
MSTSDRMVALEALAGAALVVAGVSIVSPGDVWMTGLGLHPGWLVVIVLAARYGPRGLFWSLGIMLGVIAGVDLARGGGLAGLEARSHDASNLLALIAATAVAWIGMMHEGRMLRLAARLETATEQQARAESTEQALHDTVGYLRNRLDRLELSLSVWRDLAGRIERGDLADAADAALELCTMRTGATAGRVQLRDGESFTMVAGRGAWVMPAVRFREKHVDATVQAALFSRQVTTAADGAGETDSELVAPVLDEGSGVVLGVIALRGLPAGGVRAAELLDLQVVASWLAPAFVRPQSEPPRTFTLTDRQRVTARYRAASASRRSLQ